MRKDLVTFCKTVIIRKIAENRLRCEERIGCCWARVAESVGRRINAVAEQADTFFVVPRPPSACTASPRRATSLPPNHLSLRSRQLPFESSKHCSAKPGNFLVACN